MTDYRKYPNTPAKKSDLNKEQIFAPQTTPEANSKLLSTSNITIEILKRRRTEEHLINRVGENDY